MLTGGLSVLYLPFVLFLEVLEVLPVVVEVLVAILPLLVVDLGVVDPVVVDPGVADPEVADPEVAVVALLHLAQLLPLHLVLLVQLPGQYSGPIQILSPGTSVL